MRFGARDYEANIGRWTTKDPIGFGEIGDVPRFKSLTISTSLCPIGAATCFDRGDVMPGSKEINGMDFIEIMD